MSDVEIRRATPDDTDAIARVHVASWRWAHAGLVEPAALDARAEAERAAQRREWFADGEVSVVVAERDDEIVGFAACGPNRVDPKGAPGEVYALYVLEDEAGHGIGHALFRAAAANLRARQRVPFVVRVLPTNERARRFFERCDGHLLGESVASGSFGKVTEVVYRFD